MSEVGFVTMDGLDATGKSSILRELKTSREFAILKTPPDWMKPFRGLLENRRVQSRFLFYAIGNLWVDRFILKSMRLDTLIFQDRSWLSTLSAHELRGLPLKWLELGEKLARTCVTPDLAVILHAPPDIRKERLMERGFATVADLRNLEEGERLEAGYFTWASKLGWKTIQFDNPFPSPTEASRVLIDTVTHSLAPTINNKS